MLRKVRHETLRRRLGTKPAPRGASTSPKRGSRLSGRKIDLRKNEQLGEAYLAINPRGVVPYLVLDSGEVIDESEAICRYFEALNPASPLFGETPLEIARITAAIRRVEGQGYAAAVNVLRNASPHMVGRGLPGNGPKIAQIPDLVARGRIMWDIFVAALDAQLAEPAVGRGGALQLCRYHRLGDDRLRHRGEARTWRGNGKAYNAGTRPLSARSSAAA